MKRKQDAPEAPSDTASAPTAEAPETYPLRLVLMYRHGGKPAVNSLYQFAVPVLPEGQIATITLQLDAEVLLQALEPLIGPMGKPSPPSGPPLILPDYLRGKPRNTKD